MKLVVSEHKYVELISGDVSNSDYQVNLERYRSALKNRRTFKDRRKKEVAYFNYRDSEDKIEIGAEYYIGLDWIIEREKFIYVTPKINSRLFQFNEDNEPVSGYQDVSASGDLNYLKMFMDAAQHPEILNHIDGLLFIDLESPKIQIEQKDDILTPFLVVHFLQLLKQIVRKGLKKSYYQTSENLNGKIKGKILVGKHLKTNVYKNKLNYVQCQFQEFGIHSIENRFLKKVLNFCIRYISTNKAMFAGNEKTIMHIANYCLPTFEAIPDQVEESELKRIKPNSFFKEYDRAVRIGQSILKRFAYNLALSSSSLIETPPFWIDMPRLFELYVYHKLIVAFPNHVVYHFSTSGNELDFLVTHPQHKMVIDAKYKLYYDSTHVHTDIRQITGYARLDTVYDKLGVCKNEIIPCLIIYPNTLRDAEQSIGNLKESMIKIRGYNEVFKIGVSLPIQ